MSDIRDAFHEFFEKAGLSRFQWIMLSIFFIILVVVSVSVGYWIGNSQLNEAMSRATFKYCTDENRAGCEEHCCDLQDLLRERCPYLGQFQ